MCKIVDTYSDDAEAFDKTPAGIRSNAMQSLQ